MWRIGNGEKVLIRGDNQLSNQYSKKIISPQKHLPNNAHVCSLIDKDGVHWLEDKVRKEFLPHEAHVILCIPLSSRQPNDSLIWQRTTSGVYSTKCAYRLLAEAAIAPNPDPLNPVANTGIWKNIWS